MRVVAISALLLLFLVASSPSEDPPGRSVLSGVEKLYVEVPHLSEAVAAAGIEEEDLTREVSLRLSRAGLIVLSAESYRPDTPFVSLALETVALNEAEIAFHISLDLQEDVFLARSRNTSACASTWYSSRFATTDHNALPEECLANVESLVDEFLAEWTNVTP